MNRCCEECFYCSEPATHVADVAGLFGEELVAVCADCASELDELRHPSRSGDVA